MPPDPGYWMPLLEAVTYIMRSAGISRAKAQLALVAAIVERAVGVRGIAKGWRRGRYAEAFWHGSDFHIPPKLTTKDIDWQLAALITPWDRRDVEHGRYPPVRLGQITVRRADVERLWTPPEPATPEPIAPEPGVSAPATPSPADNRSSLVAATKIIIEKLTGSSEPPDRVTWKTGVLVAEVQRQWAPLGGKGTFPGRTTIEIAAQRRKP
jgi:hypothetical protein